MMYHSIRASGKRPIFVGVYPYIANIFFRYRKWDAEKVLSFVPPDGNFRLMSYHISNQSLGVSNIPIFVKHNINIGVGKIDIQLGTKNIGMNKSIENVVLEIIMPKVSVHSLYSVSYLYSNLIFYRAS